MWPARSCQNSKPKSHHQNVTSTIEYFVACGRIRNTILKCVPFCVLPKTNLKPSPNLSSQNGACTFTATSHKATQQTKKTLKRHNNTMPYRVADKKKKASKATPADPGVVAAAAAARAAAAAAANPSEPFVNPNGNQNAKGKDKGNDKWGMHSPVWRKAYDMVTDGRITDDMSTEEARMTDLDFQYLKRDDLWESCLQSIRDIVAKAKESATAENEQAEAHLKLHPRPTVDQYKNPVWYGAAAETLVIQDLKSGHYPNAYPGQKNRAKCYYNSGGDRACFKAFAETFFIQKISQMKRQVARAEANALGRADADIKRHAVETVRYAGYKKKMDEAAAVEEKKKKEAEKKQKKN